jgi:hypothetical protein
MQQEFQTKFSATQIQQPARCDPLFTPPNSNINMSSNQETKPTSHDQPPDASLASPLEKSTASPAATVSVQNGDKKTSGMSST